MRTQRLMRTWYKTDVSADDPDYVGAFSVGFPTEDATRRIVAVNWAATPGEVEVTWLINE